MPSKTIALRPELKQTRPFHSTAHEALLSVLRTAAALQRLTAQIVEESGITVQQYNVLRILRGAGDAGLPTLAIRDRMVEEAAGITRLLDKLERGGFVVRERSTPDRRQVLCRITPGGLLLLEGLDAPVDAMTETIFAALDEAEQLSLVELLGAVRGACHGDAGP
jgi:DNA-binding MarR family transcriptional regulator